MAVSTIKKGYKTTRVSVQLSNLTWTQSGLWYAVVPTSTFEADGEIISLEVVAWSGLTVIPLATISNDKQIGISATAKPTSGAIAVRVVEIA